MKDQRERLKRINDYRYILTMNTEKALLSNILNKQCLNSLIRIDNILKLMYVSPSLNRCNRKCGHEHNRR